MRLRLYVIPGSHPCAAVEAALALKDLEYERVDMLPGLSALVQLAQFGRRTVPGLKVDGYRVVGSRLIMRALEGIRPDPPLYPADPRARAAVERAERWGDEKLQTVARGIMSFAVSQRPESGPSILEDANLPPVPEPLIARGGQLMFRLQVRLLGGGEAGVRRALAVLPRMLDRVDALIADGTIGGEQPNAADLQLGASVRILTLAEDLRAGVDARRCGALARRLFPRYPGSVPAGAIPAAWLPDLAPSREPEPVAASA